MKIDVADLIAAERTPWFSEARSRPKLQYTSQEASMLNLDDAIRQRHSSRNFLATPMSGEILSEALALA
jgi:hypothetical protein